MLERQPWDEQPGANGSGPSQEEGRESGKPSHHSSITAKGLIGRKRREGGEQEPPLPRPAWSLRGITLRFCWEEEEEEEEEAAAGPNWSAALRTSSSCCWICCCKRMSSPRSPCRTWGGEKGEKEKKWR